MPVSLSYPLILPTNFHYLALTWWFNSYIYIYEYILYALYSWLLMLHCCIIWSNATFERLLSDFRGNKCTLKCTNVRRKTFQIHFMPYRNIAVTISEYFYQIYSFLFMNVDLEDLRGACDLCFFIHLAFLKFHYFAVLYRFSSCNMLCIICTVHNQCWPLNLKDVLVAPEEINIGYPKVH